MNRARPTHLLYLHGFRSSPQSAKAQQVARFVAARHPALHWCCPQLPPSPRAAMTLVRQHTAQWPRQSMAVIGSSLGGFYATALAHERGCRAVLLNPAVHPAQDLARHIGEHSNWHTPAERFYFQPEFIDELRALQVGAPPQPQQLLVVIAKGDEVLNWREMQARYPGSPLRLLEGGDHALSGFESTHLQAVMAFLDLA